MESPLGHYVQSIVKYTVYFEDFRQKGQSYQGYFFKKKG